MPNMHPHPDVLAAAMEQAAREIATERTQGVFMNDTQTATAPAAIDFRRNGLAQQGEEKYAQYQAEPTEALAAELRELVPDLVAEIDEAQQWALTAARHRESLQARVRELCADTDRLTALLNEVRDYVGNHGDGEVDVWALRELLAGRAPETVR